MIDEDFYRQAYREINDSHCIFEKSILTIQAGCRHCRKILIAEREAANCMDEGARQACKRFLKTIMEHARFSLQLRNTNQPLGHAKAIKMQVGSLRGLYAALYPERQLPVPVPDIYALITEAGARYDSPDKLPFTQIILQISAYQGRKRRQKK